MRFGGIAITLTGVLAVSACSAATANDEPRTATVAVAVPGGKNASGTGADVVEAVEAAFAAAAQDGDDAWEINIEPVTDRQAPEADDLVAVIGGLADKSVLKLAPALNASSVLFVSPADGERTHTRGADPVKAVRPYESYFTVAVEDADPLEALTEFAVNGRAITSFATIDAGNPDRISAFRAAAKAANADVPVSGDASAADDVLNMAKSPKDPNDEPAGGVFVSGEAEKAAEAAATADGVRLPTFVDPEVDAEEFLEEGDQRVDGAVSVSPPTLTDDSTARPAALPDTSQVGAAAYDAAVAVATTLGRCLPSADSALDAREGCVGEMREVAFAGSTGEVSFNEFGERAGAFSEVVIARDGKWTPVAS